MKIALFGNPIHFIVTTNTLLYIYYKQHKYFYIGLALKVHSSINGALLNMESTFA